MRALALLGVCLVAAVACTEKEAARPAQLPASAPVAVAQLPDAGPARSAATPAAVPAAPSTGREMPVAPPPPKLDPAVARQMIAAALVEARKPERNCAQVVGALMQALPVAEPKVNLENLATYEAFAECLSSTRRYRMLLMVGHHMLDVVPQRARPWFVPRALVGLGRYVDAAKEIERLEKLYPQDTELVAVGGFLLWSLGRWEPLLKAADRLLTMIQATPLGKPHVRARTLRLEALFHLGRLDEAEKECAVLEKLPPFPGGGQKVAALVASFKKRAALVRSTELAADFVMQNRIPLGVYHLYGVTVAAAGGAVMSLSLYNFAKRDRQLRVEVEIPGVTERVSQTVMLLKDQAETIRLAPPLKVGFDIGSVRAARPAQLVLRLSAADAGKERILYDETLPVSLLPRDSLPLSRRIGEDNFLTTFEYAAAWVTPNAKAVDAFLSTAKKRAPRSIFAGEQQATLPQVKALWEELQARGVSYVMDPALSSVTGQVQRTRLPAEVLSSTNAQCLEGTLLLATLMEAVGLRPLIAFVPGHALVGWRATTHDGAPAGKPVFLETTLVHDGKFEDAVAVAMKRMAQEEQNLRRGLTTILDLAELRKRGVSPQPAD